MFFLEQVCWFLDIKNNIRFLHIIVKNCSLILKLYGLQTFLKVENTYKMNITQCVNYNNIPVEN